MPLKIGNRVIGVSARDRLPEKLYSDSPRIGVVVGTYGSLPYVHLQLEAWKRFCPDVHFLIHDDASPLGKELEELCQVYGAEFESTNYRLPTGGLGDMAAFLGGFLWAADKSLDLLVKFSRRFVPKKPWLEDFKSLVAQSQGTTFSHECRSNNWKFRTECMAAHVHSWFNNGLVDDLKEKTLNHDNQFVEGYMHSLAGRLILKSSQENCRYIDARPALAGLGYIPWEIMGISRNIADDRALWHNRNSPKDYHTLSESWGLKWTVEDFENVKL